MTNIFAISDIHGQFEQLSEILSYWNKEDDLVIMGDMIDRGDDSLKVIHILMEVKNNYPDKVTILKGNHEDMFLNYIENPEANGDFYLSNGGDTTCYDFGVKENLRFMSYKSSAQILLNTRQDEINFIKDTITYYEFGKVLFVHAGIDSFISDWRKSTEEKFYWTESIWMNRNESGKVIVFGHTPTQLIHKDKSNDVWISKDKKYIGIDGGSGFRGQLNAILMNDKGELLETYVAK